MCWRNDCRCVPVFRVFLSPHSPTPVVDAWGSRLDIVSWTWSRLLGVVSVSHLRLNHSLHITARHVLKQINVPVEVLDQDMCNMHVGKFMVCFPPHPGTGMQPFRVTFTINQSLHPGSHRCRLLDSCLQAVKVHAFWYEVKTAVHQNTLALES